MSQLCEVSGLEIQVARSPGCGDTCERVASGWEEFLRQNPRGQFQQSLRWAEAKALDGWSAEVQVWPRPEWIEGGFMMLYKSSRFGRVGFVNKGPVCREETPEAVASAIESVCQKARALGLRALVVQPPDASGIGTEDMVRHGFLGVRVPGVVDAAAMCRVDGGRPAIEGQMSRSAKQNCRQAVRRGVEVVEGRRDDLPVFFDLMLGSCRRQRARPNPARVEALERLWDAFDPDVRLFFARLQGQAVAGLLLIKFGKRCTFWKKGWNERVPETHANALLNFHAMVEAAEWGCDEVDFVAMDRRLAERWKPGHTMDDELGQSRHAFNLRLGARPVLLPRAQVYVSSRVLRPLVGLLLSRPALARLIEGVIVR